jgi:hypothetical protein
MKSAMSCFALGLLIVTGVRADTIFTTFGTGHSFSRMNSLPVGGVGQTEFAASFAPTQDFTLDGIDFAVALVSGQDPLNVEITTDSGALSPGAPLETFSVSSVPTLPSVLGVDSPSHPLLIAGATYWVVLSTAPGTEIGWDRNDQHFVGVSELVAGSPSWKALGTEVLTPAFDVLGTPVSGTIPEPASFWLMAAGISLCGVLSTVYHGREK